MHKVISYITKLILEQYCYSLLKLAEIRNVHIIIFKEFHNLRWKKEFE